MEEKHRDHRLIACLPQHDTNIPSPKRKRRKTFKMMEQLLEIEETHRPTRVAHDMSNEPRRYKRKKRAITNDLHHQVEIKSSVVERAEEVQANLDPKFPSFVKPMIHSNVQGGFWLSLPRLFCELHLPSRDETITLVDVSHREYYTNYLPYRKGLSGGWRGFSIAHNLEEGDVLVFHLIGVCKMKVYIVRANGFSVVDAALSLLHLHADAKVAKHENKEEHLEKETGNFLPVQEKLIGPISQEMLHSNFDKCVQSFKSKLVMNETRNISDYIALALEGLILETTSVAKAIKVCKRTTSPHDFTFWNKFESFHIVISQIRSRLDQLFCLVNESRNKSYEIEGLEEEFGDRMSVFEVKMQELREATQRLYEQTEVLIIDGEMYKLKYY